VADNARYVHLTGAHVRGYGRVSGSFSGDGDLSRLPLIAFDDTILNTQTLVAELESIYVVFRRASSR
jgi:hypothetical protein